MNSNVAGTSKAGAKVEAAFDIQLKECPRKLKMPCAKRSVFPAVTVKLVCKFRCSIFGRRQSRGEDQGDAS